MGIVHRPETPTKERGMYLWELRYRGAMSVDNVLIETITDREEEAIELGQAYLDSLATPSVRFVRVRRIVVARTVDNVTLHHKWTQPLETLGLTPVVGSDDEEMAPLTQAAPVSPLASAVATGEKVKENAPRPPAGKPAAAAARAKVLVPKGTDPPPEPEGSRVQTHTRDVRQEARDRIAKATKSGRAARIGD